METDWILDEIATGLQKLYLLSLDRTPAAELLAGTAQAWHEALTDGREWDERLDAPRFRRAFVVLAQTARRWPAPAEFMDALPKREQLAIARESRPATREEAAKAMARIEALLRGDRQQEPEPESSPEPERDLKSGAMAATEAYLQAHYDRKRAAAGDAE